MAADNGDPPLTSIATLTGDWRVSGGFLASHWRVQRVMYSPRLENADMRCDRRKLQSLREQKGITQEKLAIDSGTGIRTIQRAERGESIRSETVAFIAEALAVPVSQLRAETDDLEEADPQHDILILRRARSASALIDALHKSYMCRLDCDVDADGSNVATLKAIVELLEVRSPDPLEWAGDHRFGSLADRLDTVAALNDHLRALDDSNIGVFIGSYTEKVRKPTVSPYDAPSVQEETLPTAAVLTRVMISDGSREKIVTQKDYRWPVVIWDDEVPF